MSERRESAYAADLRNFLTHTITTFKVITWGGENGNDYSLGEMERTGPETADVASSLRKDGRHAVVIDIDHPCTLERLYEEGRPYYQLIIRSHSPLDSAKIRRMAGSMFDAGVITTMNFGTAITTESTFNFTIAHPTWLVRSSTPDHYHLYIDVPGGINSVEYFDTLYCMAEAGIVERGYQKVSKRRGHSDVRLPWKKKEKSTVAQQLTSLTAQGGWEPPDFADIKRRITESEKDLTVFYTDNTFKKFTDQTMREMFDG